MKKRSIHFLFLGLIVFGLSAAAFAQTPLKRTVYKTENLEFGVGGTIDIVGAPNGSIFVEGWQKNEVEIYAEIQSEALSEEDLRLLAEVNGFTIAHDFGSITITSVGTHDKRYLKKRMKDFPKRLRDTPYRIDYKLKVPFYSDLKIDGGRGDFKVRNIDGAMQINFLETNAEMILTGGAVVANFGAGTIDVKIATSSWRGGGAAFQLASGVLNLEISPSFNGFINAKVLRTGKIENECEFLKPQDRTKFSETFIQAKSGGGGATLGLTVGDGTLKITKNAP